MVSAATSDRAERLRRSLQRLRYDLKAGECRGRFHITRDGSNVDEAGRPVRLDLAGVEAWITAKAPEKRS